MQTSSFVSLRARLITRVCKPTDLVRSLVMDDKAKARGAAGISGL